MLGLNNRELASAILFLLLIAVFVLVPKLRRQLAPGFAAVLRSFFVWKIQLPLLAYFVYAFAVVFIARWLGAWDWSLLKDTIIIVVFVGVPLFFSANKVREGSKLVRNVARGVLGATAILIFYINLGSLPLWGELLLQTVIAFLVLLAAVAHSKPEHREVEYLANGLLGFIGLCLLVYTTRLISSTWDADQLSDAVAIFVLSVWLPLALIPFVYILAFLMRVETILTMLPFVNDRRQPPSRVRLAGIWGLHLSTRLAAEFSGQWRGRLATSGSFHAALGSMREFRRAVKQRDRRLEAYNQRQLRMAGHDGADEHGLRLDRREFAATKRELTNLCFMQMGWYRNQGNRYRAELLDIMGDLSSKGLPTDHGIRLGVRRDGQAWRAWRQTPGGWYFGVGGTRELLHQWQYDGPNPPSGYPSPKSPGWINTTLDDNSPEWRQDDEPPNQVIKPSQALED